MVVATDAAANAAARRTLSRIDHHIALARGVEDSVVVVAVMVFAAVAVALRRCQA